MGSMTAELRGGKEQQYRGASTKLAFGLDVPAVCFHEMFDDRKPESGSAFLARATGVDSIESLEDAGQMIGGNAGSGITDAHQGVDT